MLKFVIVAFTAFILVSCSGPSEIAYEPTVRPDTSAVDLTPNEYAITPEEFLKLPFTLTAMSDDKWKTTQTIRPNNHNKRTNDTLLTLQYLESVVHIQNHNLVDGRIVNNEIHLVKNIHVGMTRSEFERVFNKLENHPDAPLVNITKENIKIGCCSEQNDMWTFSFDADTIYQIEYSGYMD